MTGTVVKIAIVVLSIVLANVAVSWLVDILEIQIWPEHLETVDRAVLFSVILYTGLMATPFLPGIEIGLALMAILGPKGVLVTYVCTIVALSISFGLGRLLPARLLVGFLRWLKFSRAADLLMRFDGVAPEKRLEFIAQNAPARSVPALLKHRHLLLALALNLPGNALIGGGGGIAMMAGMSRLYAFPTYVLLISLAVLPGPVIVLLSDLL